MTFRKLIFWVHLVGGVTGALCIGIMCFTGTVLAFEKQITAWAERDVRRVEIPASYPERLSLDAIQQRLREKFPEARPVTMVIQNDPGAAIAFPAGRAAGYYVNPYTGEARRPASTATAGFMARMLQWHRYLGFSGETTRPRGKWINGACNLVFCVLAISGLYLWLPRRWTWKGVQAVAVLNWRLVGKARDFNWHNTLGVWSAPILIVLTLTAVPMSFQWGGRVINSLVGTPQPTASSSGGPGTGRATGGPGTLPFALQIPAPAPDALPLSQDSLVAAVQKEIPGWKTITVRIADGETDDRRQGGRGRGRSKGDTREDGSGSNLEMRPTSVAAATFTVRNADSWPRTANLTVAVNPYTGEIVRRSGHADLAPAAQVRAWTRFLHTGEALGWGGQLVAGLACAGGCMLVWTGLALAWRRFFPSRNAVS